MRKVFLYVLLMCACGTMQADDSSSRGKYSNPAMGGVIPTGASKVFEWLTPESQNEALDRGLVALPERNGKGIVLTWRMSISDGLGVKSNTTYDIYRNETLIKENLANITNYVDANGKSTDSYYITVKQDGEVKETSKTVTPWTRIYKTLQLDRPAGGTLAGTAYDYTPNDMSVADLDGDGEYELIVKWNPSNSHDNSESGYTSEVFIDAYKMDGTKMWRVSLGKNIRAGAHYTQSWL